MCGVRDLLLPKFNPPLKRIFVIPRLRTVRSRLTDPLLPYSRDRLHARQYPPRRSCPPLIKRRFYLRLLSFYPKEGPVLQARLQTGRPLPPTTLITFSLETLQRSLVLLSKFPYPTLFTELISTLGPAFLTHGGPMLEAACHNIASWYASRSMSLRA
jgi:hypothetical protein